MVKANVLQWLLSISITSVHAISCRLWASINKHHQLVIARVPPLIVVIVNDVTSINTRRPTEIGPTFCDRRSYNFQTRPNTTINVSHPRQTWITTETDTVTTYQDIISEGIVYTAGV